MASARGGHGQEDATDRRVTGSRGALLPPRRCEAALPSAPQAQLCFCPRRPDAGGVPVPSARPVPGRQQSPHLAGRGPRLRAAADTRLPSRPRPNLSLSCGAVAPTSFSSFGGAASSRKLRSRLSSGTKSSTFWTLAGASEAGAGSVDSRHQLLPSAQPSRVHPRLGHKRDAVWRGCGAACPAGRRGAPSWSARAPGASETGPRPAWDACAHLPRAAPGAYLGVKGPPRPPARSRTAAR